MDEVNEVKITSVEKAKDPKRVEAGKKLGAMSKQAKEKKASQRMDDIEFQIPSIDSINPLAVVGVLGVVGAVVYYKYFKENVVVVVEPTPTPEKQREEEPTPEKQKRRGLDTLD